MPSFSALSSVPKSHEEVLLPSSSLSQLEGLDEGKSITINTRTFHGIIRPWMAESRLPKNQKRYKIDTKGTPGSIRLITLPLEEDIDAPTFIIEWFKPKVLSVISQTVSQYWKLLKPWQKAATVGFLALDAIALGSYAVKNNTSSNLPTTKLPESSISPLVKKIDGVEKIHDGIMELSQTRTIRYIMDVSGKTIPELFLLNPSFFEAFKGVAWESLPSQRVVSGIGINVGDPVTVVQDRLPDIVDSTFTLDQIQENPDFQKKLDQYYTMLENMMSFECALGEFRIVPKDIVAGSDTHGGEQYAGINMEAAKKSNNPQRLAHAQEIQACYLSGNQKKLQILVKTYYLLYYFPDNIQSHNPAITAFLLDTSMNRGKNSLSPICQMVINELTKSSLPVLNGTSSKKDKEGNIFEKYDWCIAWPESHQNLWSIVCQLYPDRVLDLLPRMREIYEDHELGPRPTLRSGLVQRWNKASDAAREMSYPMTYRYISYHNALSLIDLSLVGEVPLVDTQGKPIIYRVQRIQNPDVLQKPAEDKYRERIVLKDRPDKKMLLFHGTASGIVGVANEVTRDKGGFNALYQNHDAAFGITGQGLVFQFFDPTRGHGAANATHIAASTGIPKDVSNLNDACIAVELCLRGYEKGQEVPPEALYGVERPTQAQKFASKKLVEHIRAMYGVGFVGTSADPVRDHRVCYDEKGNVRIGEKFLIPSAHRDDFCPEDRKDMGILPSEDMAKIFRNEKRICDIFDIDEEALRAYRLQIAEKATLKK